MSVLPDCLIDPVRLKPLLGPLAGRFDVDVLAECASSNTELAQRAEAGAPSGSVLVVDRQTAGRGRRGRTWLSQPADSLTFSLLWRFPGPATRVSGLSLAVGLAVGEALRDLGGAAVRLKWPNDILLAGPQGDAKLGGILVELAFDRRGVQAVIGIGLNLAPPQEVMPQPTAGLGAALPTLPERHVLLATLLGALAQRLDQFAEAGFAPLAEAWSALDAWRGRPVRVLEEGRVLHEGRCLGCDAEGALLIETAAGIERVLAGDVSLRL